MEKVKVLGFNPAIGKSVRKLQDGKIIIRTKMARELLSEDMYLKACKKAAERLGVEFAKLVSKRQAAKFYRGQGIVYQTIMGADNENS